MKLSSLSTLIVVGGFLSVLLFSPQKSFAVSVNLQSNQATLNQDEDYTVNVVLSISSANGTQYYLRGAFFQQGTSQYCGYTFNGTSYYNGPYTTNNGWTNLLPITVQNSSWSGTLKAKVDTADTNCANSGTYNFKVERFTTSGTGTFDSQNEQTVQITIPTPTPTPLPTATSIPPTNTTAPTATTKPTQKPTATNTPTFVIASISAEKSSDSGVLGSSISTRPSLVASAKENREGIPFIALFLITGGIFLITSCGILFYYRWEDIHSLFQKSHEQNNE